MDLGPAVGNKRKPLAVVHRTNDKLYSALLTAYRTRTTDYEIEYKKGGIGRKVDRVDLSDAYRRAGLKKPEAPQHILKHTCISWLVQDGKEIAKIAYESAGAKKSLSEAAELVGCAGVTIRH